MQEPGRRGSKARNNAGAFLAGSGGRLCGNSFSGACHRPRGPSYCIPWRPWPQSKLRLNRR
ncbi:hypothetical protein NMD1_03113 [Novosphingobium sp. MD-1]|nr:hypothetical protein NMD1_03113 [Novosphingobium sp. MD-1]